MNKEVRFAVLATLCAIGIFGLYLLFRGPAQRPVIILTDPPSDGGVRMTRPQLAALGTVVDPLTLKTGVSGTVNVTAGYVVGLSAVAATGDAGNATITITPNGPAITDGAAIVQPAIQSLLDTHIR